MQTSKKTVQQINTNKSIKHKVKRWWNIWKITTTVFYQYIKSLNNLTTSTQRKQQRNYTIAILFANIKKRGYAMLFIILKVIIMFLFILFLSK